MTVARLCSCGQVLLEVAERLVCPGCRRPASAWRVLLNGEVVARRHVGGEVEVAPAFREALQAALAGAAGGARGVTAAPGRALGRLTGNPRK